MTTAFDALSEVLAKTYPGGKHHDTFAGIIIRNLTARGFTIVRIGEAQPHPITSDQIQGDKA